MTKLLVVAALPLFLSSCATITRGTHDKLYVQSEPSGAEAKLSSGEKAITPAKFVKSRRESFSVTVSKPGYIAQTVRIESKVSATGGTAMAGNVIAGGIVGIAVDAGTGALFSLYPNPVVVQLVPTRHGSSRKSPAQPSDRHKKTAEVKLQPRTTKPEGSSNGQNNTGGASPAVSSEPSTLQSVEPAKPSASPSP